MRVQRKIVQMGAFKQTENNHTLSQSSHVSAMGYENKEADTKQLPTNPGCPFWGNEQSTVWWCSKTLFFFLLIPL